MINKNKAKHNSNYIVKNVVQKLKKKYWTLNFTKLKVKQNTFEKILIKLSKLRVIYLECIMY